MALAFLDLRRQLEGIRPEIDECLRRVLDGGNFILGQEVAAFEDEFAAYHGTRFAVGVGNGTDAIALALRASGRIVPGEGHEVITTALTAGFTALGILMAGAVPVFADVRADTLLMDPASVEVLIGPKTRTLLPVHLYGQSADLSALRDIADRHGLILVEDCGQAHGTRWGENKVGTVGEAATFSFYPTKNLGAYGDGGMVLSSDERLIQRVRMLHKGGMGPGGTHLEVGINSRLDEIQAALLRVKLKYLDGWNRRRAELANRYHQGLAGARGQPCIAARKGIGTGSIPAGHSYHLYVIRHPERGALQDYLRRKGVQTLVHYPQPLHLHEAFRANARSRHPPRVAEQACREVLSLPLYPELQEAEQDEVITAIRQFDGLRPQA